MTAAASDLLALAKPRITALVVFTTASGLWLAPRGVPARTVVFTLIGTVLIGALPGAIPPLIGWTAATGRLDLPGVLLFAVMFLWQVPHFLAITLFRKEEYAKAGLIVQPNEPGGERAARTNIVRYTVALVGVSLLFVPLGVGRGAYLAVALMVGAIFLGYAIGGLRQGAGRRWARNLFLLSLLYLPVLFGALV